MYKNDNLIVVILNLLNIKGFNVMYISLKNVRYFFYVHYNLMIIMYIFLDHKYIETYFCYVHFIIYVTWWQTIEF